ncbi:MAG: hypothetical protein AAF502_20250 [Bacteroidota bacterium]
MRQYRFWNRYYLEDGKSVDLLENYQSGYGWLAPFLAVGQEEEWAIVDLSDIRNKLKTGKIYLPEAEHKVRLENPLTGLITRSFCH